MCQARMAAQPATRVSFGQIAQLEAIFLPPSCAGLHLTQASWSSLSCASCCTVCSACAATMSKLESMFSGIHWPVMGGRHIATPSLAGASVSP